MDVITTDVLVVGGGTGGSAAAIQAARQGVEVVLVSELPWLGGMLTSAGVSAPDGNELAAFQTGIWGAFLKELRRRHGGKPGSSGLDNGWVSFFTYNPAVGAQIFADWVRALPNLRWIVGQRPKSVLKVGDRVTGVQFDQLTVQAHITLDGTELGDVLALGDIPYRWGWETQDVWNEPSAPRSLTDPSDSLYVITQRYPVQSPTWVVIMQDYGQNHDRIAPKIDAPPKLSPDSDFAGAWANYGDAETPGGQVCLDYGRLPNNRFMINWPHQGNDYGVGLDRLIESEEGRSQYGKEAQWHSQSFARYIQQQLGDRYGLATDIFPRAQHSPGGGFALMPYYRESRRLIGLSTISERDILPVPNGQTAALPVNSLGQMEAIALGNYPNDHHYPGFEMPLAPKAFRWGGRWTGTPFTIPYSALVPKTTDGLLACEKNISVSHIANGATRLQPVVLGIGQAAGMAAALCVQQRCQPRDLCQPNQLKALQSALISDPVAPAAIIPLFNLAADHSQWHSLQKTYLLTPETYPKDGHHTFSDKKVSEKAINSPTNFHLISIIGTLRLSEEKQYKLHQNTDKKLPDCINLVTVRSEIAENLASLPDQQPVRVLGTWNEAGKWILCEEIQSL